MRPTIAFVALLGICLAGCQDRPAGAKVAATTTVKTYSREEFRQLVMGKTPDEVIAAVGKPKSTSDSGHLMWTYDSITRDPVSGKMDTLIFVHFNDGKTSSVHFP